MEDLIPGAIGCNTLNDGQSYRKARDIRNDFAVGHTDAEAIYARNELRADRQDAGIAIDRHTGWSTREGVGVSVAEFVAAPGHNIANPTSLER